jgi:hypothetical protein
LPFKFNLQRYTTVADAQYLLYAAVRKYRFLVPVGTDAAAGAGVANVTTAGLLSLTARLFNADSTPAAAQTRVRFEVKASSANQAMSFSRGTDMSATSDGVVVTAAYQLGGTHAGFYHALATGPNVGGAFWPEDSGVAVLVETFDTFGAGEAERNFPFFSSTLSPFLRGSFEALQSFKLGKCNELPQVRWITTFDGLGFTQLDDAEFLASFKALFIQQVGRALGVPLEFVSIIAVSPGAPAAVTATAVVAPGGQYATAAALKTALEDDPTVGFGQSPGLTKYCPCALAGAVSVTNVPANLAPPPPPAAAGSTAELSALSLGGVDISPDFSPQTYEYKATATAATTSVIVSFTTLGVGATVSFTASPKALTAVAPSGEYSTSGSSPALTLAAGENTVTVRVTSADLSDVRVYTFTVTRLAFELNTELSGLTVATNDGAATPALRPSFAVGLYKLNMCFP